MPAHLFASSVVALIVALFNGAAGGLRLRLRPRRGTQALFACGPAGVALFAIAWFATLLAPPRVPGPIRAAAACVRAARRLAASPWTPWPTWAPPARAASSSPGSRLGGGAARRRPLGVARLRLPRRHRAAAGAGAGPGGLIGAVRGFLSRHENAGIRRLSRHVVALVRRVAAGLRRCARRWSWPPARRPAAGCCCASSSSRSW